MAGATLMVGVTAVPASELNAHTPLTLRSGPGERFGVHSTLQPGARIDVLWCNAEATWCLVQGEGNGQGWAPITKLQAGAGGGRAGQPGSPAAAGSATTGAARSGAATVGAEASASAGAAASATVATPAGTVSVAVP